MLVDSGASVSVISTGLWEALHREEPGWTLLSTDCCRQTAVYALSLGSVPRDAVARYLRSSWGDTSMSISLSSWTSQRT